ncbi:MAG: sugar/nucleoside kinase (ribokinase family) [Pseudohongiellaceae bacterium]|jgi:sugar/nucleoside kinase (ribokinase family)
MKKYHVYGIGAALVDKEFEVEDSFFEHESIQKGIMTLVDGESQDTLLQRLMDKFGLKKRAGGGSAGNSIYAISQFGGSTFFSCKVANDEFGDFFLEELGHLNIDTNLDNQTRDDGVTGKCLVMVSPDAERTMLSYLGISETLSKNEIDVEALKDSEYLYLEGYQVTSDSGREACIYAREIAKENGVKTAITLSDPAMVQFFRGGLQDMIGDDGVDLLFANDVEAREWAGKDTVEESLEELKKISKQIVITRGSEGALLFDGEKNISIAPHSVKAVDSNGAGDMFAGAFLYAVSAGHDFETAGNLASLAAATTVSHFGPRLTGEQHQEIKKQII